MRRACPLVVSGLNGETEDDVRERVFDAAMNYVPKYGWSRRALAEGKETLNFFIITPVGGHLILKAKFSET